MKTTFCVVFLLFIGLSTLSAQEKIFLNALENHDISELTNASFAAPSDIIHRDIVIRTVEIMQMSNAQFEPGAAEELEKNFYIPASAKAVNISPQSDRYYEIKANTTRFVAYMVSCGKPQTGSRRLIIAKDSFMSIMSKFCPCFPFC